MAPDPTNPADLPASWLPGANPGHPKPPAYARAVARKVHNARHQKVLAMAEMAEDTLRAARVPADALEQFDKRWWLTLAKVAGHPCKKVTPETRAAVIEKVTRDMAEPYQAKGRGPWK